MKRNSLTVMACLLAAAALAAGCRKEGAASARALPSVAVAPPSQELVADRIDLTGTVSAFKTVDLVARVQGYLQTLCFQDGSFVQEGNELFLIEPNSYEQQLRLSQAALLMAQSEYDRQMGLMKENATSAANVEHWLSERDQASAQVELAKLNLSYTHVKAPFNGRIGRRLVDPGNLVGPNGNAKLATLEQLVPIYVYFTLNERDTLVIRQAMRERFGISEDSALHARVYVGLQTEDGYPREGTIDFVDTGVNPSLGAIQLRAVFPNEDKVLLPGLFVRVRIPLSKPMPMLAVPNSALGSDQEGDFVLVVNADDTAARRSVAKGPRVGALCAIRSGLEAQDRVIVQGIVNVKPGDKVAPTAPAPRATTTSAPAN